MSRSSVGARRASKRDRARCDDPCTTYARDVVAGRVVAGELIRRACQRHLDDLESDRGIWFDAGAAQDAYDFVGLLRHSKGRWAGQPFVLEPWQYFVVGCIFGWRNADGSRRFRFAHVEVARKNGKTTLAAAIGLALLVLDCEPGAEVYAVATKRDQAKLTHGESSRMVRWSPALHKYVKPLRDNLTIEAIDAKYEPLGADADTLDGLNVHGAICDELHAWRTRNLWDVIETARGARRQPLILSTTTAGTGRDNIWWERRDLAVKILKRLVEEESLLAADEIFAAIFTLDEGDDWTDERCWVKANPSLGVSLRIEDLRSECRAAKLTPGKQNPFKRLRLNVPTQQTSLWLDLAKFDRCEGADAGDRAAAPGHETLPPGPWWDRFKGRPCFSGVDLSATIDMSAAAHVFPPIDEREPWHVLMRFWLPDEDLPERCRRDKAPYDVWAEQGWLELIPGAVIEHEVIEARIRADALRFNVQMWSFDRHMANQLTTRLAGDGFPIEGFGQGFLSMAAPVREFESLIASGRFAHGGNPVLRFNAACAACRQDPAGNRKPDKARSTGRIDGLFAILNGLGKAIVNPPAATPSVTVL